MGFVSIFGKSIMKNAYLPKISILLQFGGEILAMLCPGDSIQILLILSQFQTLRTETKLEGFVWSHHFFLFLFYLQKKKNTLLTLLTVRAKYITRQYHILPTTQCLLVTYTFDNTRLYLQFNTYRFKLNID